MSGKGRERALKLSEIAAFRARRVRSPIGRAGWQRQRRREEHLRRGKRAINRYQPLEPGAIFSPKRNCVLKINVLMG